MEGKSGFLKKFGIPIAVLLAVIGMTSGLIVYGNHMSEDLVSASVGILQNVAAQQKFVFFSTLNDKKYAIKTYASFLGQEAVPSLEDMEERLAAINFERTFDSLTFAKVNGDAVKNTGERLNIAERDYFGRALAGETVISDPVISKVTHNYVVTFATPVYNGANVTAVLTGVYDAQHLAELLMPQFGGKGHTYVSAADGQVIFQIESEQSLKRNDNVFDAFDGAKFVSHYSLDEIKQNMRMKEAGVARYTVGGDMRFIAYSPVGINDWYMFTMAPDDAINSQLRSIMHNTTGFVVIITLITMIVFACSVIVPRRNVRELSRIAFVDSLTGAANKKQFKRTASRYLAASRCKYAMVILDIDKFTVLNDTLGHECGDWLLIDIAEIFKSQFHERECFGRCDSDEYYLLLEYVDDQSTRDRIGKLMSLIENNFAAHISSTYNLVLCAGVYVITNAGEPINSITDRARHAHRLVKGVDESSIRFYKEEMRNRVLREKEIENKMHGALENEEFMLYLQPKYYLQSGRIYGAEALVRWEAGSEAIVYPNNFIPLFERNGFVTKLDMYMLERACRKIRGWLDAGTIPIPVSINFSRLHLRNPSFVDDIARITDKYQIPSKYIEVELTESTMLDNEEVLIAMLTKLHEHGFTLSMDDFGSGYSSLGLLKNLPVDVIKLDRTFFVDYSELDRAITVISGIVEMARNLGIKTVAEGVETKEQIDFLSELGCDIVQGYYYAKPMPADNIDALI